ncbi:hypothetical protein RRG08_020996 [Elysia crispata]|uniref:Serine protease n=1 Tax=Elysia crispata TaxID=231223 RepID=A0AAE1CLT9_9GAST|nr:hypothetical protein RRG08_020996 [Elysia crispata]
MRTGFAASGRFIILILPVCKANTVQTYFMMETSKHVDPDIIKRKRNDQGLHECEVFGEGPEAMESARTWASCSKNPGHAGFIPYPEFRPDHLPVSWHTPERLEIVRIIAEVTVRLRVGYTSMDRPEGFAFHNLRGSNIVHTGSGWIYDIRPNRDVPCPCQECALSPSPHKTWMEIIIATACHVVYNTEEAKLTHVDLFYDDEQARRSGKMKTVLGSQINLTDEGNDTCLLRCATHDNDLCEKLFELRAAAVKAFVDQNAIGEWRPTVDSVCVIISHPHGRPKQVTVGQVKAIEETDGLMNKLTYSACTCPGSSGAPVLPMDTAGSVRPGRSAVHSIGGISQGFNQSSSAFQHYRPRYDHLFYREFTNFR